jgi:hypothetical protein
VERGGWVGGHWQRASEPAFGVDQSQSTLHVDLDSAQAVRVSW